MIYKDELNEDRLKVFRDFEINLNLPKNKKLGDEFQSMIMTSGNSLWTKPITRISLRLLFGRLCDRFKRFFINRKPIKTVMSQIKSNDEKVQKANDRVYKYIQLIKDAHSSHQEALAEKLEEQLHVVKMESILYANEFRSYISEKRFIKFVKNAKDGLRLVWIKNYIGIIPEQVRQVKLKIDDLKVFDNYLIFHYDPSGIRTKLTIQEKEAKKDPILFGVIKGSNKLYFIDDWVDEYCDMTMDKIVDVVGSDSIDEEVIDEVVKSQ